MNLIWNSTTGLVTAPWKGQREEVVLAAKEVEVDDESDDQVDEAVVGRVQSASQAVLLDAIKNSRTAQSDESKGD